MKIILFGKNGQLGWALQRSLAPLGQVVAYSRSDIDFSNPRALQSFLASQDCDVIVNAAAYTGVDNAEYEPELARAVNEDSVEVLATHAASRNLWLVHYSTDYVFDGTARHQYTETDVPRPLSTYGQTKWHGELAVAASGCRHLILRTSWVHSVRGRNFVKTILQLAATRDELHVTADQFGAPTSADLVADVTAHVLHYAAKDRGSSSGTYNVSAAGEVTWYDYARWLISVAPSMGFKLKTTAARVIPIAIDDRVGAARRPNNCTLDTAKLLRQFGLHMPNWKDGVSRTMQEIAEKML